MNTPRIVALLITAVVAGHAGADQRLWLNDVDTYTITRSSVVTTGDPPADFELADDFEVTGLVRRAIVYGHDCWQCAGVFATGVRVRIHEKTAAGAPGAELYGFRLDAGDPRFVHDLNQTGHNETIDVTFPQPFAADGGYFFAVQLEFAEPASWPIWSSNHTSRFGSPVQMRDNLAGGDWQQHSDMFGPSEFDFAFALYGEPPGPPPSNTVAGCGEWHTRELPLPDGATGSSAYASKSFGMQESWLVGGYDRGGIGNTEQLSAAWHRIGDGAWQFVPTPSPDVCSPNTSCAQVWFNAIDGVAPDDVWAGGWQRGRNQEGFVGGQLFLARWDGTEWRQVDAPVTSGGSGAEITAIKAFASDDVWFVGSWITPTGWPALTMHWDGSGLSIIEAPFPTPGTPGWSLAGVDGVASNDLWAVGHGSDGDMSTLPYVIHWDGTDWQLADVPAPGDSMGFGAALALSSDDVYAGGSWFTAGVGYGPMIMHYDGSAWTLASGDGGGGPMISFGSGSVLALGNPTLYFDGTDWIPQPGLQDYDYHSVTDLDATGPCHAVGGGIADIVGERRAIALELKPIVFGNGFE